MSFYTDAQRAMQARFGAEPLGEAMRRAVVHAELTDRDGAFIASRDMLFLATVDAHGQPSCSYKGGEPGFVQVVDPRTLAFPLYDGNGMFISSGNIQDHAQVGLLFIDFEVPNRLRVQGRATLHAAPDRLAAHPGADLVVQVDVEAVFVNCSRHVHTYRRIALSRYSPGEGRGSPYPEWKRIDAFQPALCARDAGKTADAGGTITVSEYGAKLLRGEA